MFEFFRSHCVTFAVIQGERFNMACHRMCIHLYLHIICKYVYVSLYFYIQSRPRAMDLRVALRLPAQLWFTKIQYSSLTSLDMCL
jgi:hypothetical protein